MSNSFAYALFSSFNWHCTRICESQMCAAWVTNSWFRNLLCYKLTINWFTHLATCFFGSLNHQKTSLGTLWWRMENSGHRIKFASETAIGGICVNKCPFHCFTSKIQRSGRIQVCFGQSKPDFTKWIGIDEFQCIRTSIQCRVNYKANETRVSDSADLELQPEEKMSKKHLKICFRKMFMIPGNEKRRNKKIMIFIMVCRCNTCKHIVKLQESFSAVAFRFSAPVFGSIFWENQIVPDCNYSSLFLSFFFYIFEAVAQHCI